jgi:hypothetical protein
MAQKKRMKTMIKIEAGAVGSEIELRLEDENNNALFRLDTHDATHLLLKICQAIRLIPSDPTAPLGSEGPSLIAWPSFQVGVTPQGELALRVRPDPLPPMELRMSDDSARNLIEGLSRGLQMPRAPRPSRAHH